MDVLKNNKNNKNITTRNTITGKDLGLTLNIDAINNEAKERTLLKNIYMNNLILDKCGHLNETIIRVLKQVDEMVNNNDNNYIQDEPFIKRVTDNDLINYRENLKNKQREFIEMCNHESPTETNSKDTPVDEK